MNKRVKIEIPQDLYRLISRYGDLHGLDAGDYATMALARHLEDLHDLAAAEATMDRIYAGERIYTAQEMERELGLDD